MKQQRPSSPPWKPILAAGRNCWVADAPIVDSGLLVDGRDYYLAFHEAALEAERYLLIAGWRFNSDVRLVRGRDAERTGGEVKFLPFLNDLCQRKPELRIYVLAWDFSVIYAHEWELFQAWKFQHGKHGRLRFLFDDNHAVSGSHHQKFVVIDGTFACVGGLDFNADDWDDRRHLAFNPDRADSGREPHDPYHDIQAYLAGPAAQELAGYFAKRWRAAGGEALDLPPPSGPPIRVEPSVRIAGGSIAVSRNQPRTLTDPEATHEIRQLYLDAIAAADQFIYLENQYFSSQIVCQALLERMRAPGRPRLDIAIVLPKRFPAWIESVAVGAPRLRMLDELRDGARYTGHRLGVYYPTSIAEDGREVPIVLHSKLLDIDDRFLTVGSCNTSNRSMGLDTELNVSWEAGSPEQRELIQAIRGARIDLLAEHCGLPVADVQRELQDGAGLVERLERLTGLRGSRLRRLTPEVITADQEWLKTLDDWGFSFDPAKPVLEDTLYEKLLPTPQSWVGRGLVWFREWLGSKNAAAEK
jgi:phospholipase D1/2